MVCLLEVGATLKQPWAQERYTGHEHSRLAPWSTVPTASTLFSSGRAAEFLVCTSMKGDACRRTCLAVSLRGFQLCPARRCCSALAVPWPCCPNARGAAGMRKCHISNERACARIYRAGVELCPL